MSFTTPLPEHRTTGGAGVPADDVNALTAALQELRGFTPVQGAPGAPGATGPAGLSAYQVALANGFSGTQAQWLASLKGAKGDTGAAGAPGAQGPAGTAGYPVVKLTQAAYNALTPDPATLYVIVG